MNDQTKAVQGTSLDYTDAIKAIDSALQRPAGNPTGNNQHTKEVGIVDNIQNSSVKAPTGTSRAAGLRSLTAGSSPATSY